MNLKEILSISGKPGLHKLVAQSRNGVIVESLSAGKRFPVMASQNVSSLADIAIYTYEDEISLAEIFKAIYKKEEGKACISHKESAATVEAYIAEVIPDFDRERVYQSDMRKVLNWYNTLLEHGLVDLEDEQDAAADEAEQKEEEAKKDEKAAE
jgi:hypothetical protein